MNFVEYLLFKLDKAIEMLMGNEKSKTECALFLLNFKKELVNPEKEIVTGEATVVDEIRYLGDGTEDNRMGDAT